MKDEDLIEELVSENERLTKQIIILKEEIKSLKMLVSQIKSDLIVHKAQQRGRP